MKQFTKIHIFPSICTGVYVIASDICRIFPIASQLIIEIISISMGAIITSCSALLMH